MLIICVTSTIYINGLKFQSKYTWGPQEPRGIRDKIKKNELTAQAIWKKKAIYLYVNSYECSTVSAAFYGPVTYLFLETVKHMKN